MESRIKPKKQSNLNLAQILLVDAMMPIIPPPPPPKAIRNDIIQHLNVGTGLYHVKNMSKQILHSDYYMENMEINKRSVLQNH